MTTHFLTPPPRVVVVRTEPVAPQTTTLFSATPPSMPVAAPVAVTNDEPFTVNIPNSKGDYNAITLKRLGNGFVGPQGEYYPEFPKVDQLKLMYGK